MSLRSLGTCTTVQLWVKIYGRKKNRTSPFQGAVCVVVFLGKKQMNK